MNTQLGPHRPPELFGRHSECEALEQLLEATRAGDGGALVVRGEAGVGKSALLEYVMDAASGCRLARAAGVQSEMELPFAGLHQLCRRLLDRLQWLPAPQREALEVAFALSGGPAPDPFVAGLALLGLMSKAAEDRPLICVVDDAQWLDPASAQALGVVARRLYTGSLAVVFGVRDPSERDEWAGLPELIVTGLGDADARALLESAVPAPLDEPVRDRIVAETRGNPRALLEVSRGQTPAQLAGGFAVPEPRPVHARVEDGVTAWLTRLPQATRELLLLAAAEPLGDPVLVWRAAAELGIGPDAGEPAAAAGLAEFGARVRFRTPLVRAAVYGAASGRERQRVHSALAEVTDPQRDRDRRAWHRAHATAGPDEGVARALELSAARAHTRGGMAAAAAFLERAAALTPEPAPRARRALHAAEAKIAASAFDAALELLAIAEAGPLDELARARVTLLRGHVAFALGRGSEATALLREAARLLQTLDVTLTRETYLELLAAASFVTHAGGHGELLEVAQAARAALRSGSSTHPRAVDLLLEGLAALIADGYAVAAPTLKRALHAFRSEDIPPDQERRWLWVACGVALMLRDDEAMDTLSARQVELARDAGVLVMFPIAISQHVVMQLFAGELGRAASLLDDVRAVTDATGSAFPPYAALMVAAWRGREAAIPGVVESSLEDAVARGERLAVNLCQYANAVLYNGLGRYRDALTAAQNAAEDPQISIAPWIRAELIEAATRSGHADLGAEALDRLSDAARASGTDWALGIEARSRALLSEGEAAEDLYREAIARLEATRVRAEVARARLLYGEWLRRERRHRDARQQLRAAHETFTAMGAEAFAERAWRDLRATGQTARKRSVYTTDELTAQEAQVARLARDGLSNTDIGARLFISPRTVEYHLHKVFTKLSISSRTQLAYALSDELEPALAA